MERETPSSCHVHRSVANRQQNRLSTALTKASNHLPLPTEPEEEGEDREKNPEEEAVAHVPTVPSERLLAARLSASHDPEAHRQHRQQQRRKQEQVTHAAQRPK